MSLPTSIRLLRATFILSVFVCVTPASAGMTYHDNVVAFPMKDKTYSLAGGSYTIKEFSISSGQDPDRRIKTGLTEIFDSKNSMTFSVGRHGTHEVANWFKNKIDKSKTTFNHDPDDLNFAFIGDLKITLQGGGLSTRQTYLFRDIAIAQGHSGLRNNWWFGGKFCTYISNNKVNCTGESSTGYKVTFTFRRGGNGVNEVDLATVSIPAYKTVPLVTSYRGESTSCSWQGQLCPPYVTYYDSKQSSTVKLVVKNNKLFYLDGTLFDSRSADRSHSGNAAIFVMDTKGNVYASNAHKVYLFHHSSLLGGIAVAGAGEIVAKDGNITRMTNCSGHYRPPYEITKQVIESFNRQGYTQKINYVNCNTLKLKMDLDYKLDQEEPLK